MHIVLIWCLYSSFSKFYKILFQIYKNTPILEDLPKPQFRKAKNNSFMNVKYNAALLYYLYNSKEQLDFFSPLRSPLWFGVFVYSFICGFIIAICAFRVQNILDLRV